MTAEKLLKKGTGLSLALQGFAWDAASYAALILRGAILGCCTLLIYLGAASALEPKTFRHAMDLIRDRRKS